jgi:hypothetical protein
MPGLDYAEMYERLSAREREIVSDFETELPQVQRLLAELAPLVGKVAPAPVPIDAADAYRSEHVRRITEALSRTGPYARMSGTDAAEDVLIKAGETLTTKEVAERLTVGGFPSSTTGADFVTNTYTNLRRLKAKGRAVLVGPGTWEAASKAQ